jgi:hypothetical protein
LFQNTICQEADESDCVVLVVDEVTPLGRVVVTLRHDALDALAVVVVANPVNDLQAGDLNHRRL